MAVEPTPRRLPDWLIGLLLAVAIVLIGFLAFRALGGGDDPRFVDPGAVNPTTDTSD